MKNRISNELIIKFCERYKKGNSLRFISKMEGVSPNTVKKYLQLQGIRVECKNMVYNLKTTDDLLIGLYAGLWAGDGTQYIDRGYTIKICCHSKDDELMEFIQWLLLKIFGKTSRIHKETRHRAVVKFRSKFIYKSIINYLVFNEKKTYSVCLKYPVRSYSKKFLKGFFLGLMLSDGYLDKKFSFNTTSKNLALNMVESLRIFGFHPKKRIHKRERYGWKDLYMICLDKDEAKKALGFLDSILLDIPYNKRFRILKGYEKSGLVEI